jgi:biotin carboxyl carrier protein
VEVVAARARPRLDHLTEQQTMKYLTTVNNCQFVIEINRADEVIVDGRRHAIDFKTMDGMLRSLLIDQKSYEAIIERRQGEYTVLIHGNLYTVRVADEREQHLGRSSLVPPSGDLLIAAPMPGLIAELLVAEGQTVEAGDTLIILESMKMGNEIKTPREGVVNRIHVKTGDSVNQNQTLIVIG